MVGYGTPQADTESGIFGRIILKLFVSRNDLMKERKKEKSKVFPATDSVE